MPDRSHVFYRKYGRAKPVVSHGEGIYLWDTTDKRYIDASGGAVVVNVGHGVKEIADAISQQAAQVAYAHATMFTNQALEDLADRLAAITPLPDGRFFFMASGSEATETAMKLAQQVQAARGEPSRCQVIARWGSYHGATLGALALTGKPSMRAPYKAMFQDVPHIPPVYCYRCPFGLSYPSCNVRCAYALEDEIKRQGRGTVAAFIAEPIAGATLGAVVPPPEYWPTIRSICDEYGLLLIVDEVMTGMGRTGRWFGIEHWGVTPDIVCMGKGVSGGYLPLSVTGARGDLVDLLWERLGDFNHGGTFSHQPVAAAAGLAALHYLESHDLIMRAAHLGALLGQKLRASLGALAVVGDIRGLGLMWGIEFVAGREAKRPFPAGTHFSSHVYDRAFESGLIVYAMSGGADGAMGDHVMVAPPLVVEEAQLDEIVALLREAVELAVSDLKM